MHSHAATDQWIPWLSTTATTPIVVQVIVDNCPSIRLQNLTADLDKFFAHFMGASNNGCSCRYLENTSDLKCIFPLETPPWQHGTYFYIKYIEYYAHSFILILWHINFYSIYFYTYRLDLHFAFCSFYSPKTETQLQDHPISGTEKKEMISLDDGYRKASASNTMM